MPNLLLAGYFGSGNLGDDAIMLGFVEGLRGYPYEFQVLSGAPEETYRIHGLRSTPRKDLKAIDEVIKDCDALVFPGGSIFQDATSVRSVKYYQMLVNKAKAAKKKVLMVGQGVGPLTSFFGKRWAADAFNSADAIAVRDPQSAQTLKALGVKHNARVTGDLAFLMPPPVLAEDAQNFNVAGMKTIGISAKGMHKVDIATLFGEFCRLVYQSGALPVLIEMDRNEDSEMIERITKSQGGKIPDIRRLQTPQQVQQRMARMEIVVAMRLHAGILASTMGVPPLMVSYDPKVAAFARSLDLGASLNADKNLTSARMFEVYQSFLSHRERNSKIVEKKRDEFVKAAEQNIELIRSFVK